MLRGSVLACILGNGGLFALIAGLRGGISESCWFGRYLKERF